MTNLESFQRTVAHALTALALVHVPLLVLICWLLGDSIWSYGFAAFGFAIVPPAMMLMGRSTTAVSFALAVTLVAQTSLLVAAFNGHPWQIEMHFYYFAVLAMLSGFCDWRVLLVAAALIAVHHIGFNELLSAAVYPGGNNIFRAFVHAIVVVIETSMLVLIGYTIRGAFATADEARHAAEATAAQLETLAANQKSDLVATATRADRMGGMLDRFKREMAETVEVLHAAAATLETNANDLSAAAQQSCAQSVSATSMTGDTVAKVNLAAQAGEELARTISQVGDNAAQSSRLAADAVSEAELTTSAINEMASVASEISNVTELISAIAAQTNLLALNATIEAARAGETGRGFAVVAQEVKALAAQTAKATNEIASRIAAMQTATTRSVGAIGGISKTIQELDQFSARIAQAVEEQAGAAVEISGNVNAAASAAVQVNQVIGEVETIAQKMTGAVSRVGSVAAQIADQTHKIRERVGVFTDDIVALRAADR